MQHWLLLVAGEEVVTEGWGREIQCRVSLFYTYDSLISSTQPECLQGVFDVLTGLSNWLVLRKIVGNTVGIVYQPSRIVRKQSEAAYGRWFIGEGAVYQARQKQCVRCPDSAADLATGLLLAHRQMQNGVSYGTQWEPPPPPMEPNTYQVSGRRMTGTGGKPDGSLGALRALSREEHGGHPGGGKPPPFVLPPL